MRLDQGQTKNYSESLYHDELAIIDTSASDADQVISVPDSRLERGSRIELPVELPGGRDSTILSKRRTG